jgi:hypothetical protein
MQELAIITPTDIIDDYYEEIWNVMLMNYDALFQSGLECISIVTWSGPLVHSAVISPRTGPWSGPLVRSGPCFSQDPSKFGGLTSCDRGANTKVLGTHSSLSKARPRSPIRHCCLWFCDDVVWWSTQHWTPIFPLPCPPPPPPLCRRPHCAGDHTLYGPGWQTLQVSQPEITPSYGVL